MPTFRLPQLHPQDELSRVGAAHRVERPGGAARTAGQYPQVLHAHIAEGRWKEATEVLAAATKAAPRSAEVWARLAQVRLREGDYEQAEKDIEQWRTQLDMMVIRLVVAKVIKVY